MERKGEHAMVFIQSALRGLDEALNKIDFRSLICTYTPMSIYDMSGLGGHV